MLRRRRRESRPRTRGSGNVPIDHKQLNGLRARKAATGAALAGMLALTGCTTDPSEVDMSGLEQAVEGVPGVDDAIASLRWDGLPSDDGILFAMTVHAPDADTANSDDLARLIEEILATTWENMPQRPFALDIALTSEGIPDDIRPGDPGVPGLIKTRKAHAAALGIDPKELRMLTPELMEARFGAWEKP